MKFLKTTIFALAVLSLASCKDDKKIEPVNESKNGAVTMQFDNYVGTEPMVLNSTNYYKNAHGDDFKVTRYKYYISNIVLFGSDGSKFIESESYHLIDQENAASLSFVIDSVPPGNYDSVQVMIGVDAARNTSGAQTGALDPANGMFWTWNSGYIMAKMEGTSPQATSSLSFHIAGFSGQYSALKTVNLVLPQHMAVSTGSSNKIIVKSDLLTWFQSPIKFIDFSALSVIGSVGTESAEIADNYANMLSVTSVQ